ncbi:MAG: cation:proton antiporter family protein [Acidimicrobiia bacterium]|nr:cation:proton antiporter family protein [Acidimicrobiia bacterium]
MDVVLLLVAFGLGFVASAARLPPLVGYLVAGFVLHAFGQETSPAIELVADLGVLLLLFGIGLKLKLGTLLRPEVWAGGSLHAGLSTIVFGSVVLFLGAIGLGPAIGLTVAEAALIGFAFSFSSTVFAVKALEDRGESSSLQGRIAIGILIVQDVFAVGYLTASTGELPSPWAIPVIAAVLVARPVYSWLLDRSGHGELLVLLGFCLAIGVGAEVFDRVGVKADLGALVVGVLLANHRRSPELAERLLGFKDLLLVGFFLSIGLAGAPDAGELAVAGILVVFVTLKAAGFVIVLSRFHLRARTVWHASITLATFSEFGLIVIDAAADEGVVDPGWSAIVAVAVAVSFALAAPLTTARYIVFQRFRRAFERLERHPIRADDAFIEPGECRILVFGLGRVGGGAYDEIVRRRGPVVIGVDHSDDIVKANVALGRRVIRGDALDRDFWDRIVLHGGIDLVVLAMNDHEANLEASRRVRDYLPDVHVAGVARYVDEVAELRDAGVDVARNLFGVAGPGLADDALDLMDVEADEA